MGAGVMVMVDRDIEWQPGDLERLIASCEKTGGIVGGAYAFRSGRIGLPLRLAEQSEFGLRVDDLRPAIYLSGGFMAVSAAALERLKDGLPYVSDSYGGFWPFFLPMLHEGEYLSEDWAFCQRALDKGVSVTLDCWPALGHEGTKRYTVAEAMGAR